MLIADFNVYCETLLALNMMEQNMQHYSLSYVLRIILAVSLTVLFVAGMELSCEGRMLSWLITSVVFLCVALTYFYQRSFLSRNIKKEYHLKGSLFGLPLILYTIYKFVINQSDRIFSGKK